jgi:hypothetical protein
MTSATFFGSAGCLLRSLFDDLNGGVAVKRVGLARSLLAKTSTICRSRRGSRIGGTSSRCLQRQARDVAIVICHAVTRQSP